MRFLKAILAVLTIVYAGIVAVAWAGQRQLVYRTDPRVVRPADVGLTSIEVRWVKAPDGVRVLTWYGKARPGQPTILYFHGNVGNLSLRTDRFQRFLDQGWGLYAMAYRGFSGSEGLPSEADNVADAGRAYEDLVSLGVSPGDIVLYGESLGTGVASRIAVTRQVKGVILDSPFTSIVDIGASRYPYLPVRLLLQHRYETIDVIGRLRAPLLVVHGEADRIVPVEMGRKVFAAAVEASPKRLVTLPGAGHVNHWRFGSFAAITRFVDELTVASGR